MMETLGILKCDWGEGERSRRLGEEEKSWQRRSKSKKKRKKNTKKKRKGKTKTQRSYKWIIFCISYLTPTPFYSSGENQYLSTYQAISLMLKFSSALHNLRLSKTKQSPIEHEAWPPVVTSPPKFTRDLTTYCLVSLQCSLWTQSLPVTLHTLLASRHMI